MNARFAAVFAVLAAIAIAAVGYAIGTAHHAMDRDAVSTMVSDILKDRGAMSAPASMPATMGKTDGGAPGGAAMAELSADEQSQVEATIRNYLIANPEIIRDAINELQRREDQAAQAAQSEAITDNASLLFNSRKEVVLGNPKGDVTLVEFFDYNCAYCRRAHADMKKLIADDPNLRVVLKEFPILSDGSVQAAQVASAVLLMAPEKYADFHDALITAPGQVDGAKALALAADLGLDPKAVQEKANSDDAKAVIAEARDLADKLQLTGTPSYATPLRVVVGAVGYDALKQELADARTACKQETITC